MKKVTSPPGLVTKDEAARILKIHRRTVEAWIERGWLKGVHYGPDGHGVTYVTRESIRRGTAKTGWKPKKPRNCGLRARNRRAS